MRMNEKLKKIFSAITDLFVFSVLVRLVLFSCYELGVDGVVSFFLGLTVGGIVIYVLLPMLLKGQTLGMKMNGLVFVFVQKDPLRNIVALSLRFVTQLFLNIVLLGIPLAINFFLMVWKKEGNTIADYIFSKVMFKQELIK